MLSKNIETIDLKQRIAQGENTTIEFKENFDQEVIETVSCVRQYRRRHYPYWRI